MKTRPVNLTNDERRMVSEIIDSVLNSSELLRDEGRSFIVVRIPVQVLSVEFLRIVKDKLSRESKKLVIPPFVPAGQGASINQQAVQ
jgi:hypothetical protein